MKQFLLPAPPYYKGLATSPGNSLGTVRLGGGDYHYLVRVRRLAPGMVFNARCPNGDPVQVLVRSTEGGSLLGDCFPQDIPPASSKNNAPLPPIVLFQALPKGAKMDRILRQAVEGGITEIVSFVSEHSVRRLGEQDRLERWRRIIREARQQSGSPIPTEIREAGDTAGALRYWETLRAGREGAVGLLLHVPLEQDKKDPLEQGTFHGYLDREPVLVAAAIGPEGGFSPEEALEFTAAGFRPVSLGTTVLRTETAALYAAAAIRIVLLESPSWIYKPR